MLEFMGKVYYIDVEKIIEKCRPSFEGGAEQEDNIDGENQTELNVFKFECFKSCVDRVLNEYQIEEDDEAMTSFTNKTTNASFGIAFNTLLKNEILLEDE